MYLLHSRNWQENDCGRKEFLQQIGNFCIRKEIPAARSTFLIEQEYKYCNSNSCKRKLNPEAIQIFLTGIKNTVAGKISLPKKIKVRSLEEVPRLGRT